MNMSLLSEIGVGGIFAVLMVKEVLNFLRYRKNGDRRACDPHIKDMHKRIEDLWNWHNVTDNDGVKIWYVRRSLEEAIKKLSENIDVQTKALQEIVTEIRSTRKEVRDIELEMKDLKKNVS